MVGERVTFSTREFRLQFAFNHPSANPCSPTENRLTVEKAENMSNKWYRRIIATAATVAAGTVAFAAPAMADEATVTTDPCSPGTIVITDPPSDGLTPEELEEILDNIVNGHDDSQDGSGGGGQIDFEGPDPDDNAYTGDIEIVITDPPPPGPIDVWEVAHAFAFTAATCGTDDPGVTPEDPDGTDTDPGAVFGSLESVSFGSLEQILGLMTD